MKPFRLFITKEVKQSLVKEAEANGIIIVEKNFIKIIPVEIKALNNYADGMVIFTSKNAVRSVASSVDASKLSWKIFCLEGATHDLVTKYFTNSEIAATGGSAEALAEKIIRTSTKTELVFFCGDKRMDILPGILKEAGYTINEIVVYKTELSPHVIDESFDGVAFFSPTAVQSFFSANRVSGKVILFSVGATTTQEIKKYSTNRIYTAGKPSEEEVLGLVLKMV